MNHDSFIWQYCQEHPEVELVELDTLSKYWITSDGQIYSKQTDKFLKQQVNSNHGYARLLIKYDGKLRNMRVHRLVALAFLDDPEDPEKNEVDHINHHRCDNRVENLRWVTHKQNMNNLKSNYNRNISVLSYHNDSLVKCNEKNKITV